MDFSMYAIVISVISLGVSFVTLYFSHLRRGKNHIVTGEHINISHDLDGRVGITLPVSFANDGARLTTVQRVGLLVQLESDEEGYLLEPVFYQRINEVGDFVQDSQPVPIRIPARQSITKQIFFGSSQHHPGEFQILKPGKYHLRILGWESDADKPRLVDKFAIIVSDQDAASLNERFDQRTLTSVRICQSKWRSWSAHPLTAKEVNLLG